MSFSNYTAQALLNALFGKTSNFGALASAPTIFVALSTADPGETGSGTTEPSGNGYARVETAAADWGTATNADPSVITNAEDIAFPQASGPWGTLTHFALYDAAENGNFLGGGALGTSKAPTNGDTPVFSAGQLSVSLD